MDRLGTRDRDTVKRCKYKVNEAKGHLYGLIHTAQFPDVAVTSEGNLNSGVLLYLRE